MKIADTIITPNGFQSWMETFHHLTTGFVGSGCNELVEDSMSHPDLLKEWTDEFETMYNDYDWVDGDYIDKLDEFVTKKKQELDDN